MYTLSGVHHVAIGVRNLEAMKNFYQGALEFSNVFIEITEAEHDAMREVLRMPDPRFAAIQFSQEAGGILVELIKMVNPVPRPIRKDFRYGDIGINKLTISVSDLEQVYKELKGRGNFCSRPKSVTIPGWGDYCFVYGTDTEGNLLEFVSSTNLKVRIRFGGALWLGVSVTDLRRSLTHYQKHFGFNKVLIESHEVLSGLVDEVSGFHQTRVRSCFLASSLGGGMLELFEVMEPRGRSIPFSTHWGISAICRYASIVTIS